MQSRVFQKLKERKLNLRQRIEKLLREMFEGHEKLLGVTPRLVADSSSAAGSRVQRGFNSLLRRGYCPRPRYGARAHLCSDWPGAGAATPCICGTYLGS